MKYVRGLLSFSLLCFFALSAAYPADGYRSHGLAERDLSETQRLPVTKQQAESVQRRNLLDRTTVAQALVVNQRSSGTSNGSYAAATNVSKKHDPDPWDPDKPYDPDDPDDPGWDPDHKHHRDPDEPIPFDLQIFLIPDVKNLYLEIRGEIRYDLTLEVQIIIHFGWDRKIGDWTFNLKDGLHIHVNPKLVGINLDITGRNRNHVEYVHLHVDGHAWLGWKGTKKFAVDKDILHFSWNPNTLPTDSGWDGNTISSDSAPIEATFDTTGWLQALQQEGLAGSNTTLPAQFLATNVKSTATLPSNIVQYTVTPQSNRFQGYQLQTLSDFTATGTLPTNPPVIGSAAAFDTFATS